MHAAEVPSVLPLRRRLLWVSELRIPVLQIRGYTAIAKAMIDSKCSTSKMASWVHGHLGICLSAEALSKGCVYGNRNPLLSSSKSIIIPLTALILNSHTCSPRDTAHTGKWNYFPLSGGAVSPIPKGKVGWPLWMLGVCMSASAYIHLSFLKHSWT